MSLVFGHVFHQQIPGHISPFHHRLKHSEHVAIDLRLICDKRTGRMQDAGVDLPSRAGLQLVGFRVIENAVIALVPAFQAIAERRFW